MAHPVGIVPNQNGRPMLCRRYNGVAGTEDACRCRLFVYELHNIDLEWHCDSSATKDSVHA